jgi:hypothetical protein
MVSYTGQYVELVERHLGRKPEPSDGASEAEISRAEEKLGLRLPASVRDYFRVAGNLAELNKAHNRLLDLSGLLVEEGFLILMEENQAVVHWGIKTSDLAGADPEVWQRVNSPSSEWYPEGMKFSEFLVRMFDWQAGFE